MKVENSKSGEKGINPLDELVGEIEFLNNEYRAGTPQASDQYYDELLLKLSKLDPSHPLLQKGIIEQVKEGTRKRKLIVPMMSLDKEKSVDGIKRWLENVGVKATDLIVLTPKFNGISLLDDPIHDVTCTRGDGIYGQDCNDHFDLIEDFGHCLEITSGEAIISRKNWEEHFQGQLAPSGLPYRLNNATVAGLLNADKPDPMLQYVDFVRYSIHSGPYQDSDKVVQLLALGKMGSPVDFMCIQASELTEEAVDQFYQENNKIYPIDGVVIDINSRGLRCACGREKNGNPAYARALKLDKWVEEFETEITGYDFTISKQGKLKGVVTFVPVFINGTEVKQATFYNARFIFDYSLEPGVNITIKKSGEIIPKIVAVEGVRIPVATDFANNGEFRKACTITQKQIYDRVAESDGIIPFNLQKCPSCGSQLYWDETNVELMCGNPNQCHQVQISKLDHFFSTLGVEEFGRPTIGILYQAGYTTIQSILAITREELSQLDGLGDISADVILTQLAKLKAGVPLAKLLYAYDLFDGKLGEKTLQNIFDNLEDPISKGTSISLLTAIKGVSDITAQCFLRGITAYNYESELIPISYIKTPQKALINENFTGFSVCFSGVRDAELETAIVARGGRVVSGVSKATTHLIVADENQSTGKTEKARALGVKIISIINFKNLL